MNYVKTAMLLGFMTALFMTVGYSLGGSGGMMIALLFSVGSNLYAWWNSDTIALRMHNAQPVQPNDRDPDARALYAMVEELAQRAGLPMPRVFIIRADQPNAFATGRGPSSAAVAATTGIMRTLTREELAGVMAHELAHVKNHDTLIMTLAATFAGALSMIARFGMFFGGGRDNRNPLGMIGTLAAMMLAPIAAAMVQMLISRTREFAADRLGGQICGNPLWLASALMKISGGGRAKLLPSAEHSPETAHMFIVNPLAGLRMDKLFSTHPDTRDRVAALQEQAREMGLRAGPAHREAPLGGRGGPWG